ncbi:MAG: dTDP-4-dehydrorhamnose reductase [Acidobacteriota bacterium]|jgi:dTDP-4-dehydrorhamnose reductase|nr:dTDP-4-dehydrorhamnose reductase [Acidobacteriota bacterium]
MAVERPQTPVVATTPLELWAGVECSVNRVGSSYFDQLERSGHARRVEDLDLFAELGVCAMRYPVLWERTAPDGLERADWSWADERLKRLRELGIRPIVGLVHHGSGPRQTSLVDTSFPEKLAQFARAVARRFPWVEHYTPINEPLTTARFSGLYGHWYPHGRDDLTFARAQLTQCRAIVLAMRAIREINPQARLIQTEDLGKTFSTRTLLYQAEFENERRWLTYDLLTGRVTRAHAMWSYLRGAGIDEAELDWFANNTCPPDIIGVNHYLTSERFLDERSNRYPASTHGGNGRHAYADVEAVRVCAEGLAGPRALMKEVWERYGLPLAVTEVHLGCTREEQLRWLKEVWDGAQSLRQEGVDVRAVTAWSLLGAFDWDSLITREEGHYEPGVFDLRAPRPRPTALFQMLRNLASEGEHTHPVLSSPGWWRRLDRLCYPPVAARRTQAVAQTIQGVSMKGERGRSLLITGGSGTLGKAFARICEKRGLSYRLLTRQEMDIADPLSVNAALEQYRPWAVINAAGYVRVDDAEREPELCRRENTRGPETLAAACASREAALLTFSSDLVFDGAKRCPYVESDTVSPLNVYGRSKAEGERRVLEALPEALVIRTSAFFGPWDKYNFVTAALNSLSEERVFTAADDVSISPTYVPDLVHASLDLLIDSERGIWHLANAGELTWAELARRVATLAGLDDSLVDARPLETLSHLAPRPVYGVLGSERGMLLPPLENALSRYSQECEILFRGARRYSQHRR